MTVTTTHPAVDVVRRWAEAEQAADVGALDALADEAFTLVGPVGFVLDRGRWLHRFGPDGLQPESVAWSLDEVADHGDAVVLIGTVDQRASHAGRRADATLRTSHVLVRQSDGLGEQWLLAHLQYSALGGPPPFRSESA